MSGQVFFRIILLIHIPLLGIQSSFGNQDFSIAVLLSSDPGSPSVEEVIESFESHGKGLDVFKKHMPDQVRPLLKIRANEKASEYFGMNPAHPRARLERYLVLDYSNTNRSQVISDFLLDDEVEFSHEIESLMLSSSNNSSSFSGGASWNMQLLNADLANSYSRGTAWIGVIDTGIQENHPAFQSFDSAGTFIGGPFLKPLSADFTRELQASGEPCRLVDEGAGWEEVDNTGFGLCADQGSSPAIRGHGTHVSGIVAAKHDWEYPGICESCSILFGKFSSVGFSKGFEAALEASVYFIDQGSSISNMSWGYPAGPDPQPHPPSFCDGPSDEYYHALCTSIEYGELREHAFVAAVGNWRRELLFPASDPRVISVGGIMQGGDFWDESPGSTINCPFGTDQECGSNFSFTGISDGKVDVVAPAKDVASALYEGYDWITGICGEFVTGSGEGNCTGTSMSAPHVSGLLGLLRSINPLAPIGDGNPTSNDDFGVRNLLNLSASRSQADLPHDTYLGYGYPDALVAVELMYGISDGVQLENRLTPLFSQYSSEAEDYHYTTRPQVAASYEYIQGPLYLSVGSPVNGYSSWPGFSGPIVSPPPPPPSAQIYVFSEFKNPYGSGELTPLYRMNYIGPSSENPSNDNRDMLYAISPSEVDAAVGVGYHYEGIEGYLIPLCTPEPACIPEGAVKVLRRYNESRDDHAIFPETLLSTMEAEGYTEISMSDELGYAFLNVDTDGDQLVDGVEEFIGTDPDRKDSNCDGLLDSDHYPLDGVPVSDPLENAPSAPCVDLEIASTVGTELLEIEITNNGPDVETDAEVYVEFPGNEMCIYDIDVPSYCKFHSGGVISDFTCNYDDDIDVHEQVLIVAELVTSRCHPVPFEASVSSLDSVDPEVENNETSGVIPTH